VRQIFPEAGSPIGPADPLRLAGPITKDTPGSNELVAALASIYAYPQDGSGSGTGSDRVWVRANMVTSVDGAISADGRSAGLSGDADRLLFHVLRGLADVVLVGAGTARAERYGLAKPSWPQLRHGRSPTPPIAVVTRGFSLDLDSQLLRGDQSGDVARPRTIVLTTAHAPDDRVVAAAKTADVIIAGRDDVSGQAMIEKLAELGHRKILVEGGPTLLGEIASAELLDELCVTISPSIQGGDAARMITSRSAIATDLELTALLEDDSFLLSRYVRSPAQT